MVIPREPLDKLRANDPKKLRGHRRDYTPTPQVTKAYLLGALHDATKRKTTWRISQNSKAYVTLIARGIRSLYGSAWIYREGKTRNVYVVEFSQTLLSDAKVISLKDKADYARGYFDTEGGIAKQYQVRYYIYFSQKDLFDLKQVKEYLEELGIVCGKIHNPSKRVDPDYWRFYIAARSYQSFKDKIGSLHPEKMHYLRMKR